MITLSAFIFMFLDHFRIAFCPDNIFMLAAGRLAFPLFAWGIQRGFKVTKSFEQYAARLLFLAGISQVPFVYYFNNGNFNICFTLLTGLFALKLLDSYISVFVKWPMVILLSLIAQFAGFEYGIYGVMTIIVFSYFDERYIVTILLGVLTLAYIVIFSVDPVQIVAALSPILIFILRDHDFKIHRSIRYGFYPLHLVLLYILKPMG